MKYKNNLCIMYCISFLQGMVFYASIATLYRTSAGLTLFQISLIESISYVLMIVLEMPWGIIADRIGYRHTMIICCMLYFISKIVFYVAADFNAFLLERILLSIVFSGLSGVDSSILYLSSEPEQSQHTFSIYGTCGTCGIIIASALTALFIQDNYRLTALLTIFPYAIAFVLSFFIKEVKDPNPAQRTTLSSTLHLLQDAVKNRSFLCIVICGGILSETVHMLTVFLNQTKYTSVGMSNSFVSAVYVGMTILSLCGIWSSRLTKKAGKKRMGILLLMLGTVSAVCMAVAPNAVLAITAVAGIELCYSLFTPLLSTLEHDSIHAEDRASLISAGALIMDCFAVIIDLVIGGIADWSLSSAIGCGVLFLITACFFFLFSFQPSHQ